MLVAFRRCVKIIQIVMQWLPAIVIVGLVSAHSAVAAQAPAGPSFSTVRIRPSVSRDARGSYTAFEDGSVVIYNMTLRAMIAEAYAIDDDAARFALIGRDDPLLPLPSAAPGSSPS
jgi:hypothetical protein